MRSPDDHHAHDGHQRDLAWCGDTVPCSETCEEPLPPLITHVTTTAATKTEREDTEVIPHALEERALEPGIPVLDAGEVDAGSIIARHHRHGIEVSGPVRQNHQWQAKAGQGSDPSCFLLAWQQLPATCPQGKQRVKWTPRHRSPRPREWGSSFWPSGLPSVPGPRSLDSFSHRSAPSDRAYPGRMGRLAQGARAPAHGNVPGDLCATFRQGRNTRTSRPIPRLAPYSFFWSPHNGALSSLHRRCHPSDPSGRLFGGQEDGEDTDLALRRFGSRCACWLTRDFPNGIKTGDASCFCPSLPEKKRAR